MRTIEVTMGKGPILINEEDFKEGVILKFVGRMPKNSERGNKSVDVFLAKKQTGTKQVSVRIEPTIPGHPNCHYGDCDRECHVVSCGIYQEYEPVPVLPADYQYEYQTVEVPVYEDE